ncbi:Putative zn(2)Cys(6) fungal-type DNA-binding domain-containing protein [Colletotrichum destructivum]|uniref:Zn(2)Cys(6) fungal-type DNA-binding domain-containing protein n=1 Tax=Colletotrichum destructivum TaxID=34406 RepID=A0AAX4IYH0_9PEZI|nr:Putative zn(2)Cys(6) fungal-type DNA-binding domain-containing protein [Colletotrichum destructivum]
MDPPGQPDNKRPRLSSTNSWSPQHQQLPPLHHPPPPPPPPSSSHPSTPHQAHTLPPHHPSQQQQQPAPYNNHQPQPPYPPRSVEPHHPSHAAPQHHHPDDRRHHDQEPPYAPMQDHYRHPPSPAHPHYPPYHNNNNNRDPGSVKREPHEENLAHPRRPHSTGGGAPPDGLPPPPHSAPPHPSHQPHQPYPDDSRRHMSYDSGPQQMPPTPGGYRGSYPPPPMAQSQPPPPPPPQHYEQPPQYQAPPESIYNNIQYSSTAKRKATRASQACDSCRQLKAKCDETKPCKSCREKGVECKYRDPIPKAIDKGQTDILEAISEMKCSMEAKMEAKFEAQIEAQQRWMKKLENTLKMHNIKIEPEMQPADHSPIHQKSIVKSPSPVAAADADTAAAAPMLERYPAPDVDMDEPQPMAVGETDLPQQMHDAEDADEHMPPGEPVAPGAPSIPANHTTRADMLLSWPGIKEMTQGVLEREGVRYPQEYPIAQEEKRGVLRLYGRGEGSGQEKTTPATSATAAAYERSNAAEAFGTVDAIDDNFSETGNSPSPGEAWGQVGGLSPPTSVGYTSGTLVGDGHPDFSEETVKSYVHSFEKHILSLHPILPLGDLRSLVKRFLDSLAQTEKKTKPSAPGVAKFVPPANFSEMSNKRKRSPAGDQPDEPAPLPRKPGRPHRTIENALVLVILALGKICQHESKIPDLPRDFPEHNHNSPANRNGYPSSPGAQASPPSYSAHSQSSGLPSPKEQNNSLPSRRHSMQGTGALKTGQSLRRNYDIIPGLEYFAYASDIMGNHMAGWTMKHAQTFIFAGLYYGQLGRVLESDAMFFNAARSLNMIMRRDMSRFFKMGVYNPPEKKRDNLTLLAFWSCLQLENDIIAELELPRSRCQDYEEQMPWPNMALMDPDFSVRVRDSYIGQLYLRKTLNTIHTLLYDPKEQHVSVYDKMRKVQALEQQLRSMTWVSNDFRFKEEDPPATDLLDARLRAKYWGARVIIYRPFIRFILEVSERLKQRSDDSGMLNKENVAAIGVFNPHDASALVGHGSHGIRGHDELDPEVKAWAERGIKALIQSTRAFHGVDSKRLLVTNIFGTAHAQWGNLLILAAAYKDPYLHRLIERTQLQELFRKTIDMLNMHAQSSSALAIDMHILQHIEKELFFNEPRVSSGSFSSSASMTGPTIPPPPPPPTHHNQGPMSMSYAVEPNHHSAHNSPSQGPRILSNGSGHPPNHGQSYHGHAVYPTQPGQQPMQM